MKKTAMVRARVEPQLKRDAEGVLAEIGLSPAEAIRLFYKQVSLHKGLPFGVRTPNAATRAAIREVRARKKSKSGSEIAITARLAKPQWSARPSKARGSKLDTTDRGARLAAGPESRQALWRHLLTNTDVDIAGLARKNGITPGALAAPARWFRNWRASIKATRAKRPQQLQALAHAALGDSSENKHLAEKYHRQHAKLCENDVSYARAFEQALRA